MKKRGKRQNICNGEGKGGRVIIVHFQCAQTSSYIFSKPKLAQTKTHKNELKIFSIPYIYYITKHNLSKAKYNTRTTLNSTLH